MGYGVYGAWAIHMMMLVYEHIYGLTPDSDDSSRLSFPSHPSINPQLSFSCLALQI